MSRDQNAGWSHNIGTDNSISFESLEQFKYLEHTWRNNILFSKKPRAAEVRESLLSFGAESSVFQFAIKNFKH